MPPSPQRRLYAAIALSRGVEEMQLGLLSGEPHLVAAADPGDTGHLGDDRLVFDQPFDVEQGHLAQRLDDRDRALEQEVVGLGHPQVFRADAEARRLAVFGGIRRNIERHRLSARERDGGLLAGRGDRRRDDVHGRGADEARDEEVCRPLVEFEGRPDLFDVTAARAPRSGRRASSPPPGRG